MKKIGTLAPGAVFAYAKKQFVVMEVMDDGVFCILAQSEMSVPFHNMDDAPRNNYVKSSLRETIEGPWLKELLANGGAWMIWCRSTLISGPLTSPRGMEP